MCKFTCLRVHILQNVGRLTRFSSMNIYCQGVIASTSGLPIGNLSQDHKCNSSGQPSIAGAAVDMASAGLRCLKSPREAIRLTRLSKP